MLLAFLLIFTRLASPVAWAAEPKAPAAANKAARPPSPRASQAGPAPRPSRAPRAGGGVKVFPPSGSAAEPVVIRPRPDKPSGKKAAPLPLTSFELAPAGPGKLTLSFRSSNPNWELNRRAAIVIQVTAPEGLEIEPSLILRGRWPATGDRMTLAVKGGTPGQEYSVEGGAAYTVCERNSKECRKTRAPLSLTFRR